jgi:uncharacterized protein
MGSEAAATERIGEELVLIRKNVPGVRGSIAATSDGLLIAHDIYDMGPTQIAALVAALHAVALRATLSTDSGQFKDVTIRASDGYLAVFAAGSTAIVAVLGTTSLNVAILNYRTPAMIERVAGVAAGLARRPPEGAAYEGHPYADPVYAEPGHAPAPDQETGLPVRRRRR